MFKIRVLFGFTNAPCLVVVETAAAVLAGLTHNPVYPVPSKVMTDLKTAFTEFSYSIVLASRGGRSEKAEMNKKRKSLVGLLEHLARWVEENCKNDLATLLSSGFSAVSIYPARVRNDLSMRDTPFQSERYLAESAAA